MYKLEKYQYDIFSLGKGTILQLVLFPLVLFPSILCDGPLAKTIKRIFLLNLILNAIGRFFLRFLNPPKVRTKQSN